MKEKLTKNFLVALIKTPDDFKIAIEENWYRIPCKTKLVPQIIKDKSVEYIAFYQPASFKDEAHLVKWFAVVKDVKVVKRKELLPNEIDYSKSEDDYYKIEFSSVIERNVPIHSRRPRRILFIPTTLIHFQTAQDINDLYYESPIEERIWEAMKKEKIVAERQYFYSAKDKNLILDFALFCHNRNIDIECDSDQFHLSKEKVLYDKKRNNFLESQGWSVLRFHSEEIMNDLFKTIERIKATINQNGGLEIVRDKEYRYFDINNDPLKFNEPEY